MIHVKTYPRSLAQCTLGYSHTNFWNQQLDVTSSRLGGWVGSLECWKAHNSQSYRNPKIGWSVGWSAILGIWCFGFALSCCRVRGWSLECGGRIGFFSGKTPTCRISGSWSSRWGQTPCCLALWCWLGIGCPRIPTSGMARRMWRQCRRRDGRFLRESYDRSRTESLGGNLRILTPE